MARVVAQVPAPVRVREAATAPARVPARGAALRPALAAALLASLAGCATVPAPPVPRPAPPAAAAPTAPPPESPQPGTQVGTTASGGSITTHRPAPVPAVIDSTPSEDALAVLRSIPEPLGTSGLPDTIQVPVPAPTQPLGDRAGTRAAAALPDTLSAPRVPPPSSPGATAGAAPGVAAGTTAVPPDSCWRVQVAAPPERDRAERMVEVARSQLLLPFVIEREGGLFKVRVRDCLLAAAANDLRRRAVESGFTGAFRFHAKPR